MRLPPRAARAKYGWTSTKIPPVARRSHSRPREGVSQAARHVSRIPARHCAARAPFGVQIKELLLTNGGDDALRVFFDTFVESGSSILICEPTFPMYRYYGEIAGARVEAHRYGPNMEFPMSDILAALRKKPRVLFICNPNNPTERCCRLARSRKFCGRRPTPPS